VKKTLRKLDNIGGLRAFLPLDDLKFDLIALLQAFVTFTGDGAIMDKYIRSIVAPKETVPLCVIEPLDCAL
jgi:hypothetical protein